MTAPHFGRLLLTGAAGTLGRQLTPALLPLASELLLSDRPGVDHVVPAGARAQACDLAERAAVRTLLQGVDAVVHLGGVSVEQPFEVVLPANITGLFNLYEAARLAGTRRIVFASSNHVTGCWGVHERISETDPARPDGYYGLSKFFGEGLASLYWDRYGIETVCLRIGTALPEPIDFRSLSSWISPRDLAQLVRCALTAPDVGFLVAFGMSRNTRAWWKPEAGWARLGYEPQDDAEAFMAKVGHITFPSGSPMARKQGGSFLGIGPFDDTGAQAPPPTPTETD